MAQSAPLERPNEGVLELLALSRDFGAWCGRARGVQVEGVTSEPLAEALAGPHGGGGFRRLRVHILLPSSASARIISP